MSDYKDGDWVKIKTTEELYAMIARVDISCMHTINWGFFDLPKDRSLVLGYGSGGYWNWQAKWLICDDMIAHKVTRDTQYIDKCFAKMDKLGKEITHSLNEAEMLLDPLAF